jgi:hypothetical protein
VAAKKKQQEEEAVKKQEQEVRPRGRPNRQFGWLPAGWIVAFKARLRRLRTSQLHGVGRCMARQLALYSFSRIFLSLAVDMLRVYATGLAAMHACQQR